MDAPVEVVEEPTAKAPLAAQAAAPRPRRPRGRKTSSTHPPSRSPSHNSTERRLLTQMEREDAKARADELQERLEGSWNSREVIRETRAQIKNLRAIEAGQHVDSSPPTQKVKQPATRKRPARKAEDHNEPSDMNGFGERPNEIAYLERRQQAWRDQHPELFRIRTRPPPAHLLPETTPPTSGSDSDSDYPGGRVRKRRRKQKDQEENEEEDYGALEQFNGELTVDRPAKSKRGNPPTQ